MKQLLKQIIATPSISGNEQGVADIIENYLRAGGAFPIRWINNVVAVSEHFSPALPTLLLNSHIDTVKPSPSYSFDPFSPFEKNGKIYGLGSNDAGASVVTLIRTFLDLQNEPLNFNLVLAITAQEENGGPDGIRHVLPKLAELGIVPDMGIVGEPTSLQPAIAERGLLVLDAVTRGKAGHAARNEGINAIYRAISDIETLRNCKFEKVSDTLGPIKITVTGINAGTSHNVIPDECRWMADIRTTDAYSNAETVAILQNAVSSHTSLSPRSLHISASVAPPNSPLLAACRKMGLSPFVSPTGSDMSQMPHIQTIKLGPGESSRSHTADEFILLSELDDALSLFPSLLRSLSNLL